jgi:hypothetical protein
MGLTWCCVPVCLRAGWISDALPPGPPHSEHAGVRNEFTDSGAIPDAAPEDSSQFQARAHHQPGSQRMARTRMSSGCLIGFHTLCCCVVRPPCRDQSLYKVFQLALTALRHLHGTAADEKLKEQAVQLALQCLSFDFVGTCLDESSEDLGTIQVPSGEPHTAQPACTQATRACRCSWCRLAGIWVPTLACIDPLAHQCLLPLLSCPPVPVIQPGGRPLRTHRPCNSSSTSTAPHSRP